MSMLLADHAGGGKEPGKAEAEAEEEEGGVPEIDAGGGGGGYAAAYVQLSFAAAAEADIYASEEPSAALAAAVQALRAMQPALLSALLRTFHEPSTNLPRTFSGDHDGVRLLTPPHTFSRLLTPPHRRLRRFASTSAR